MITEQLIKQAQQGNSDAFTKIYNETIKTAYYVAKRILLDEQAVEDVLQESYIAVYEHLGDYKAGNFQGWVDTIVANRAKNYLRKKNPILFSQMETEDNAIVEFEEEKIEFRPEENIDYKETRRLVMNIVDGLSEDQRLTTILFYFEQKSIKEIAMICECSENTVKSRLNYARKKIKEDVLELEKKGTKLYCAPILPFLYWLFREELKRSFVSTVASGHIVSAVQKAVSESAKQGAGVVAKAQATAQTTTQAATTTSQAATTAQATTTAAQMTTAQVASAVAADAAVKTGMALGTKIAIGAVVAVVTLGGGTGAVMAVNHFVNESQYEVDDDREEDEDDDEDRGEEIYDTEETEVGFGEPVDVTNQFTSEELDMYNKLLVTMSEEFGYSGATNVDTTPAEMEDYMKINIMVNAMYRNNYHPFASVEEAGLMTHELRSGYMVEYDVLHFTEDSFMETAGYLWDRGLRSSEDFHAKYNSNMEDGVTVYDDGTYDIWPHEGFMDYYTITDFKIIQTSETTYRMEAVANMTFEYSTLPSYTITLELVENEQSPFAGMTITKVIMTSEAE